MEVPTGSCQVCGTGRRLKKDGTLPRHKSVYGDVCPGAEALPAPAEDKLRGAIAAARARGDRAAAGGLTIRLIRMQPNWGELQTEWGELERYFRMLGHVFYLVEATAKYSNCRFCGKPVNDAIYAWAKRQFAPQLCGPECARKEHIKVHGCCEKATPSNCVCTYSFTCPDHGEIHVGTHD